MQKSSESLYRRAKATVGRETDKIDHTELLYLTITSLRKAKGFNSIEKQITDLRNTKTKQPGLLRPIKRPSDPTILWFYKNIYKAENTILI